MSKAITNSKLSSKQTKAPKSSIGKSVKQKKQKPSHSNSTSDSALPSSHRINPAVKANSDLEEQSDGEDEVDDRAAALAHLQRLGSDFLQSFSLPTAAKKSKSKLRKIDQKEKRRKQESEIGGVDQKGKGKQLAKSQQDGELDLPLAETEKDAEPDFAEDPASVSDSEDLDSTGEGGNEDENGFHEGISEEELQTLVAVTPRASHKTSLRGSQSAFDGVKKIRKAPETIVFDGQGSSRRDRADDGMGKQQWKSFMVSDPVEQREPEQSSGKCTVEALLVTGSKKGSLSEDLPRQIGQSLQDVFLPAVSYVPFLQSSKVPTTSRDEISDPVKQKPKTAATEAEANEEKQLASNDKELSRLLSTTLFAPGSSGSSISKNGKTNLSSNDTLARLMELTSTSSERKGQSIGRGWGENALKRKSQGSMPDSMRTGLRKKAALIEEKEIGRAKELGIWHPSLKKNFSGNSVTGKEEKGEMNSRRQRGIGSGFGSFKNGALRVGEDEIKRINSSGRGGSRGGRGGAKRGGGRGGSKK